MLGSEYKEKCCYCGSLVRHWSDNFLFLWWEDKKNGEEINEVKKRAHHKCEIYSGNSALVKEI